MLMISLEHLLYSICQLEFLNENGQHCPFIGQEIKKEGHFTISRLPMAVEYCCCLQVLEYVLATTTGA